MGVRVLELGLMSDAHAIIREEPSLKTPNPTGLQHLDWRG